MHFIATLLAVLAISTPAAATFCDQDAFGVVTSIPNDDDRRVFDRTLVSYVKGTVSTPNDASSLALSLLWDRSLKFMEQPRELARVGRFSNTKWNDEEVALYEAITASAIAGGGLGFRVYEPTLAHSAFRASWEVMMNRRQYVVYDCR